MKYRGRSSVFSVAALLAMAAGTSLFMFGDHYRADAAVLAPENASPSFVLPAAASSPPKVLAYYFHVTVRCVTCRTIESYSREAIEQGFAKELKEGTLELRPVNVQLPENRHFIRDYQLYTRSLVLVKLRDGKQVEWRNLEKVWELVGRKRDFFKYVQSNVKAYLGDS